ncbi:hypothetical protein Dolphis_89 [Pseudomonas phage Dolphis]|nr:hypothetical protein Dolphis_89 [Pseudomonas phage Dolphis]
MQVYCVTGVCQHAWINVRNVRAKLNRPSMCTNGDGPYTRLRWKA